jgi:chorismate dehydratase
MIRVGAVNYLNTKPLIEGLTDLAPGIDLTLDLPSRLADQMARNELDVGLIPVVELFRAGNYSFIPDCSISSRGPVLSVTLFSRVPWDEIRSVSLDEGSRTSAALTKVLLWNPERQRRGEMVYRQLPLSAPADDVPTDAVLLIGDRAMKACLPGFGYSYDLGQLWHERTGLPMVFAVWAVRPGVDLGDAEFAFVRAKRHGLSRSGVTAAREARVLGLDPGYVRRYFDTIIRYDLGEAELAGLRRFAELAGETGLAPKGVQLVRYHRPHPGQSR